MLDAIRNWRSERATARAIEARAKGFGLLWYALSKGMPIDIVETAVLHLGRPDTRDGQAFYDGSVDALKHWREFLALKGSQK